MSVEVSYSGNFEDGFFVAILNGVNVVDPSTTVIAPLIDERDGLSYSPIQLVSDETTTPDNLKFHSQDKVSGIMVNASVTGTKGPAGVELNIKVYVEGELVDDRNIIETDISHTSHYTILAEDY